MGEAVEGRTTFVAEDQHTIAQSVALHLLPGVLVLAFYVLVGAPVARGLGYPPLLGLLLSVAFALVPSQLGLLLYLGRRRNGSFSLEGIVTYREALPVRRLVLLSLSLFAWAMLAGAALARVDATLFETLFSWVPGGYLIEQGLGSYLADYSRSVLIVTLLFGFVLSGLAAPVVEELYFRGYLLPRLSRLGAWAPVLNVALFALYHLWTPWQAVTRFVAVLPAACAVQRTRSVYAYMWVHCALNTLGILLTLAAVLAGVAP